MNTTNLRNMIQRFETTGTLSQQPGLGRKTVSQQLVEEVAAAIVEPEMANVPGTSSARAVSRYTQIPYSTVRKILNGGINTPNCRICAANNPHACVQEPLYSPKVTVWCGFTTSFIIGSYFCEENRASDLYRYF